MVENHWRFFVWKSSFMHWHRNGGRNMSAKVDFLYLSEQDMVKAGVKDMSKCV